MATVAPGRLSDPVDGRVASRLKRRRRELGLDPRVLDIIIGESQGTIERIEARDRRVGAAQLFRLSEALDVAIDYFFEENGNAEEENTATSDENNVSFIDPRLLFEAERFARAYRSLPGREIRERVLNLIRTVADRDESQSPEATG